MKAENTKLRMENIEFRKVQDNMLNQRVRMQRLIKDLQKKIG